MMLSTFAFFVVALGILLWFAADPSRLVYVLPFLLGFEYRVRPGIFSFDLAELSVVVVLALWFARAWKADEQEALKKVPSGNGLIALIGVFAFPSIFFEFGTAHAASVYRDLMIPFLFFILFVQAGLEKKQIYSLIQLACVVAVANACLGLLQYNTGRFLWFAGPDETDWQAYKIGLAKLSALGPYLGIKDTLPVGLYTGANNFSTYLSLPLCLTSTLTLTSGLSRKTRLLCGVAAVVMFAALVLTIFRSGLVVYAASMMLVYFVVNPRKRLRRAVTALLLAVILGSFFLTQGLFDWDQFGSFQGRQEMVAESLSLIKAHPELLLTGGFSDLYHMQSRETQEIHNLFLYGVVHFGLLATLLFFAFFIRFFRRAMVAASSIAGPMRNVLMAICVSICVNVFLYGASTMLIDSVQTSIWLLFWVGIGVYLIEFQVCPVCSSVDKHDRAPAILRAEGEPA